MILSVLAFLTTSMVGLAHAETLCDPSSEICNSQHVDENNVPDNDVSKDGCDLACNGCHAHCHHYATSHSLDTFSDLFSAKEHRIQSQSLIYLSDLIYGLKRPPKA